MIIPFVLLMLGLLEHEDLGGKLIIELDLTKYGYDNTEKGIKNALVNGFQKKDLKLLDTALNVVFFENREDMGNYSEVLCRLYKENPEFVKNTKYEPMIIYIISISDIIKDPCFARELSLRFTDLWRINSYFIHKASINICSKHNIQICYFTIKYILSEDAYFPNLDGYLQAIVEDNVVKISNETCYLIFEKHKNKPACKEVLEFYKSKAIICKCDDPKALSEKVNNDIDNEIIKLINGIKCEK